MGGDGTRNYNNEDEYIKKLGLISAIWSKNRKKRIHWVLSMKFVVAEMNKTTDKKYSKMSKLMHKSLILKIRWETPESQQESVKR